MIFLLDDLLYYTGNIATEILPFQLEIHLLNDR